MIQEAKKILHGKGNDDDQWLKKRMLPSSQRRASISIGISFSFKVKRLYSG